MSTNYRDGRENVIKIDKPATVIKTSTPGSILNLRSPEYTWVMDAATGQSRAVGMEGEFLYEKTPLQLANIIALLTKTVARIEIVDTINVKGMFLYDMCEKVIAHIVDARVRGSELHMFNRAMTVMKCVGLSDREIQRVVSNLDDWKYRSVIVTREHQVEFDGDVLVDRRRVRDEWAIVPLD